jgi:prepilin-type N-terminal cleavage/methylation domain-containing protein/prepilin-type processing-associated H-X9-DG protein
MTASCTNHECTLLKRARARQFYHRRGFTLIELLVVIGIIGLLASILIPVANRALASGKSVTCKSHLKSIGTGIHLVLQNSHGVSEPGFFPPMRGFYYNEPFNAATVREFYWFGLVAEDLGLVERGPTDDLIAFDPDKIKPKVFFCPSAWPKAEFSRDFLSYGLGSEIGGGSIGSPINIETWLRLSAFKVPARFGMVADSYEEQDEAKQRGSLIAPENAPGPAVARPGTRHKRGNVVGANLVYVDGHVDWKSFDELNREGGPFVDPDDNTVTN